MFCEDCFAEWALKQPKTAFPLLAPDGSAPPPTGKFDLDPFFTVVEYVGGDIEVKRRGCGCITDSGFRTTRCERHPLHPDWIKYASEKDPRCTECGQSWPDPTLMHRCGGGLHITSERKPSDG